MMNHNIILLNAMSDIDEQVIDKNTEERCRRMRRGNKRPGGWVKWVAIAACICLILPLGIFLFGRGQKQIPVYQGMTISSAASDTADAGSYAAGGYRLTSLSGLSSLSASSRPTLVPLVGEGQGMEPDRELAPGHDERPDDRPPAGEADGDRHPALETRPMEEIVSDPADLSGETTTGESETDSLTVEGSERDIYYATSGEDIYITVHISNPDNYEILSFTLNGKTYASYMFEPGSDMEHLILKYNVGDVEGIVEYTIDAIKYVDGTQIKDVLMEGDQTVRAGVHSDKQPTADIQNEVVGINTLSFGVTVTDPLALISQSGGLLYAVMTDGTNILSAQALTVGEPTTVTFDGLATGRYYAYGIVAYYDSLDGNGIGIHILAETSGYTQSIVGFENVEIAQESVSFGLVWHETQTDRVLMSATLYLGETAVQELDPTATTITGLLSNTTYRLSVTYHNGDATETAELTFTTAAKTIPTLSITAGEVTQSSLSFGIELTDPDSVGALTSVELLHGDDEPVAAEDLTARVFEGLLTNNEYIVRVTVTYDLNDGTGAHTLTEESRRIRTKDVARPEMSLYAGEVTQSSIGFDLSLEDKSHVVTRGVIELLHDGDPIAVTEDMSVRVFENLLSDNTYRVRVTVTYDTGNGQGEKTLVKVCNATTKAKVAPSLRFAQAEANDIITGSCSVTDRDHVLLSQTLELLEGDEVLKTDTPDADGSLAFDGLKAYTEYTLLLTYTYDLCDGTGVKTGTAKQKVRTRPEVTVTSCTVQNTSSVPDGGTIYLQIDLQNPYDATITQVQINGCMYNATQLASLIVQIPNEGQFEGGLTTLRVEALRVKNGTRSWVIPMETVCEDSIFINGKIEVLSAECVDRDLKPIDWGYASDKAYMLIHLNNPTGYSIDNVTVNGATIRPVAVDANTVYVELDVGTGMAVTQLSRLTYNNGEDTNTLTCDISAYYYRLSDEAGEVHYISTPDDLLHMSDDHYYELTQDIDLSGMLWNHRGNLHGVLNGNGHSIRNMSAMQMQPDDRVGLFAEANGVIYDLHMENCHISAVVTEQPTQRSIGIIASYMNGILRRCTVDAASDIGILDSDSGAQYFAGGLIGNMSGYVTECTNNASISAKSSTGDENWNFIFGGIAGFSSGVFRDCVNNGTISAPLFFAGGITNGDKNTTQRCLNTGSVRGSAIAGGIQCLHGDSCIADRCLNVGDISSTQNNAWSILPTGTQNSYSLAPYGGNDTGVDLVTLEQLSDPSFYTDVLGWDASIWCFDDLDPANGKYPTLR